MKYKKTMRQEDIEKACFSTIAKKILMQAGIILKTDIIISEKETENGITFMVNDGKSEYNNMQIDINGTKEKFTGKYHIPKIIYNGYQFNDLEDQGYQFSFNKLEGTNSIYKLKYEDLQYFYSKRNNSFEIIERKFEDSYKSKIKTLVQ